LKVKGGESARFTKEADLMFKSTTDLLDAISQRECRHPERIIVINQQGKRKVRYGREIVIRGHLHQKERSLLRKHLFAMDPTCRLCTQPITFFEDSNLDHIIPRAEGGYATLNNLQLTHVTCNWDKGYPHV
jgi:5-methylcytosine-specific restriction endonuclease McrA